MIKVTMLGSAGTMPLANRFLTSAYIFYNGHGILMDCGEGTQISLARGGLSFNDIDIICITHAHGDHIFGLPGLLLTMAKHERKKGVIILTNQATVQSIRALLSTAPIPFKVNIVTDTEISIDGLKITQFPVRHSVPTCGFKLVLDRKPMFLPEKAQRLGIPVKYWRLLQLNQEITVMDPSTNTLKTYTPDMVLGRNRKGISIVYSTDTRPCDELYKAITEVDLAILEGMYGEPGDLSKARSKKHMTMQEALKMARSCYVKRTWLTHFSSSIATPKAYSSLLLPNESFAKQGMGEELNFDEKP